jgi:hypothetical protein
MVYNATDGDQLWLDFDGQFMLPTTAVGAYEFTGGTVRFPDAAGTASIEDVLGDLGRVELDFDGAIRYRARAPTPGASFGAEIGIGGSLTAPPLPHHPRPGLIGHLDQRNQRLQTGPGTRP